MRAKVQASTAHFVCDLYLLASGQLMKNDTNEQPRAAILRIRPYLAFGTISKQLENRQSLI